MTAGQILDEALQRLAALEAEVASLHAELAEERDRARQRWFDARGAAEYIGVSVQRVRNLTAKRAIPHARQDGRVLYDRDALDRWLEAKSLP